MSEYQYYEFQAIDRPLSDKDIKDLRQVSTRAQITVSSFINEYNWGDFKGDPFKFMKLWFDLHLYFANWGSRRVMIRLPKKMVKRSQIDPFLRGWGIMRVVDAGDNLILDIDDGPEDNEYYDNWHVGQLSGLPTLRSDILSGDWRTLYVAWLWTVEHGDLRDEEKEPLPGIGPLNSNLIAFANFFRIDQDLVLAAAEGSPFISGNISARKSVYAAIDKIPSDEKTDMLFRLIDGDPLATLEVRKRISDITSATSVSNGARLRTAAELRARAKVVRKMRLIDEKREREADRKLQEIAVEKARIRHLDSVRSKGELAWKEVEDKIQIKSGRSYDAAAQLLSDLKTIAEERGTIDEFFNRLDAIRSKYTRNVRFIDRISHWKSG